MKKLFYTILSVTQSLKISNIAETCSFNVERFDLGKNDFTEYQGSGHKYKDVNFPAARSSLYWSQHENEDQEYIDDIYKKYVAFWKRPNEMHA